MLWNVKRFFLGAGRKISLHFPASCGILLEREIKSPGVVQLIERVVWDHEAASLSLATRTSSEIPITATFPPCGENCAMMGISSLFAHKRFAGLRAEERGTKDGGGKIECIPRIERGGTIPNRNRAALLWMEENQDIFSGTGIPFTSVPSSLARAADAGTAFWRFRPSIGPDNRLSGG